MNRRMNDIQKEIKRKKNCSEIKIKVIILHNLWCGMWYVNM